MAKKKGRLYKPMKEMFLSNLDNALLGREKTTKKDKEALFAAFWELDGADLEAEALLAQHEKGEIILEDDALRDCVMAVYGDDNLKAIEKMSQLGIKNVSKTK